MWVEKKADFEKNTAQEVWEIQINEIRKQEEKKEKITINEQINSELDQLKTDIISNDKPVAQNPEQSKNQKEHIEDERSYLEHLDNEDIVQNIPQEFRVTKKEYQEAIDWINTQAVKDKIEKWLEVVALKLHPHIGWFNLFSNSLSLDKNLIAAQELSIDLKNGLVR